MRCLVLGHSGTAGFGLTSVDQTWPALLAPILADSGGEEWPVSAAPLFPVGDRAIEYALARTADIQPDLVVLSLNAFPCVVPGSRPASVTASEGARSGSTLVLSAGWRLVLVLGKTKRRRTNLLSAGRGVCSEHGQ